MNTHYAHLSSREQFDELDSVFTELDTAREYIVSKSGPETRYETRRNALEVLQKIAKSIMLCDVKMLRHEIMKDGVMLGEFAGAMCKIAGGMSVRGRRRFQEEGCYEKLVELEGNCDANTDMGGPGEAI
jgi:hypothetical protein